MDGQESQITTFVDALKVEILGHPAMSHPFWSKFREGRLERRQLQTFGLHYYQHVLRTRLYAAAVLARTPFEGVQGAIASVLWDEYGQGDAGQTHPAQFRKMLRALGLTENEWNSVPVLPELEMYADVHYRLCTAHDIWVGLGAVGVAMELPIPTLYDHLVKGFLNSGLKEDDLEFFIRHGPMDIHHAGLLIESLRPHLVSIEDRESLRAGARRSMDVRFILMDGLHRSIFA